MARSIISYDKDLPEIPDRRPWEKPTSFLVKDPTTETGWRVDAAGRRPSRPLRIPKLRTTSDDPPRPVIIEPLRDRLAYDIAIPITKPRLTHNVRKLSALDPAALEAIYDQEELDEVFRHHPEDGVCHHRN